VFIGGQYPTAHAQRHRCNYLSDKHMPQKWLRFFDQTNPRSSASIGGPEQ
jgi:hypothetical protein